MPTPARSGEGRKGGGARDQAPPDSAKPSPPQAPTPVRAMTGTEAPSSPTEADAEEVEVEVDGDGWTVRVLGRSGGSMPSRVPMLLLGFWQEGDDGREPAREALVVGRTLEALSGADLEGALRSARPPRPREDDVVERPARARSRRGGTGRRRGG